MTVVVAFVLAGMQTVLKPVHDKNEAVYNKRSILLAVNPVLEKPVDALTDDEVQTIFDNDIEAIVVDSEGNRVDGRTAESVKLKDELAKPEQDQVYPVYIYSTSGKKYYIMSIRGQGLWDAIWANVAVEDDLKTVVSASFDHAGETPGLGAEIKDNPAFSEKFQGKKIYSESGEYTSVKVVKGIVKEPAHEVDGITGATVTCNGVSDMLYDGLKNYEPYLKSLRKN